MRQRLLIWRAGEMLREKLVRLGPEWRIARFAPPFRGMLGSDALVDAAGSLPFEKGTFSAVYARRILEHLAPDEAGGFVRELSRILAHGGVLRISVPDTEASAKMYLHAAERARRAPVADSVRAVHNARLMLVDQFVRRVPGGALAAAIDAGRIPPSTVRAYFGDALGADGVAAGSKPHSLQPGLRQRIKETLRLVRGHRWVNEPHAIREAHLWIWDRYSLPKLLREEGFVDIHPVATASSAIPDWRTVALDVSDHGPHDFEPSLIMEARRG